ncbi:hypothetical protein NAF17_15930 [Mucilaginibacter sp. RB4R14]|uniref:hypothetical protein n=1 Tax=Mucilaginibacter aurantiaciroseus TaxID=2949308 RepID=UPI002090D8D7|nr:hypothetical protein [Mucilaginibacter aurantiaciroseus]MCO5937034.1 hypothetical protein [Mucilaginibacter aurantiaciroseus]
MKKLKYLFLLLSLFLFACKKEQVFTNEPKKSVVSLRIKGAVISQDTLEFVLNNKVLARGGTNFDIAKILLRANDKVQIRKKADGKVIGAIDIAETPFNQERKIFYDGTTLLDNIVITPVTNPQNMGVRLSFNTPFADFYGGAVDIEVFHRILDLNTFEFTYISVMKINGLTQAFGDFFEFPPLPASNDFVLHGYVFKVYKAGTNQLPYTKMDKVQLSDPDNTYGDIGFTAGASQLLIVSPYIYDGFVVDGYAADDVAGLFK